MRGLSQTRATIVVAVMIVAPCFSWVVALAILHGRGSAPIYGLLFMGLPFVLTLSAARSGGARVGALLVAFVSAGIGLVSWLYLAAVGASKYAN